jgi:hypothetical protein
MTYINFGISHFVDDGQSLGVKLLPRLPRLPREEDEQKENENSAQPQDHLGYSRKESNGIAEVGTLFPHKMANLSNPTAHLDINMTEERSDFASCKQRKINYVRVVLLF